MRAWASWSDSNQCALRHSRRKVALKDSTWACPSACPVVRSRCAPGVDRPRDRRRPLPQGGPETSVMPSEHNTDFTVSACITYQGNVLTESYKQVSRNLQIWNNQCNDGSIHRLGNYRKLWRSSCFTGSVRSLSRVCSSAPALMLRQKPMLRNLAVFSHSGMRGLRLLSQTHYSCRRRSPISRNGQ